MLGPAGKPRARLGHSELQEELRPVVRRRRLGEHSTQEDGCRLGSAVPLRRPRCLEEPLDDPAVGRRLADQQVLGDPLRRAGLLGEEPRGAAVAFRALGAGQLSDQVTLTGLANPTAPQTVTFRLFGPADATCASAPVFTSLVVLTGGTAQSAAFTPAATGTYRWIASYDGDANNLPASGTCGDPTENTEVTGAPRILPPAGTAVNWILVLAMSIVVVGGFMVTVARRKLA